MADKTIDQMKTEVLDTYFHNKTNLPNAEGRTMSAHRTTQEIKEELAPMVELSDTEIIEYMQQKDYHFVNDADGIVKWAIWYQK